MLEIKPVNKKSELMRFVKFQWKVYKNDPYWVPPLIMDMKERFDRRKNPFFEQAEIQPYIAEKDGMVIGRIIAIKNEKHNKTHNDKTGFFGFFEVVNDFEVTKALLDKCRTWLKGKGMDVMRGPMNFDINDLTPGFLIEGFGSSPVFEMAYNPTYYNDYMLKYGMRKAKDLNAFYFDTRQEIPDRILRIAELVRQKHHVDVRTINMKSLKSEIEIVKRIYNKAWEKNWGALPLTDAEIEHLASNLRKVVIPELILFAFIDGNPVGFSMGLPDYNLIFKKMNGRLFPFGIFSFIFGKRRLKTGRLMLLGVIKEYRKRGIEAIFYVDTIKKARDLGFIGGETSWVLEDNDMMNRGVISVGGKLYKKYRIYEIGI